MLLPMRIKIICLVKMSTYLSQVIHFIKGPPFRQETGDFKGVQYQEIIESSLAMGSIKGTVNLEETADFHTSVQTVSAPTQAHNVELRIQVLIFNYIHLLILLFALVRSRNLCQNIQCKMLLLN